VVEKSDQCTGTGAYPDPAASTADILREKLSAYDGKATTFLGEAEKALSETNGYLDALIALSAEPEGHFSNAATWLIKSALEKGAALTEVQIETLIEALLRVTDWAAQLHICQSLRFLTVPEHAAESVADWLTGLLASKRPFLRAWSLDALGALAEVHKEYAQSFNAALHRAQCDEAASVRARARNLSPA